MPRITPFVTLRFLIFILFIGIVSVSPSLKIIPSSLIVTSFHDCQRLAELQLISLVLLHSIAFTRRETHFCINNTMRYAFYVLIILAITSSCLAKSPRHALIEISLFAGLSYLALFVAHLYRENSALLIKRITYVCWAGVFLCMASFYAGYITASIFKTPVSWPAPLTGFSNIRFFNQYQLWSLGLITLPLLAFEIKSINVRRCLNISLAFWWALMFFSASRGALLAWIFGIVLTAITYRKLAWPFIRMQLAHITAGFFIYVILFKIIPSLREFSVNTGTVMRDTTNDRLELWSLSLNLIQDHPIFGVGPMHFAWNHPTSAHPHNSILQLMAEWGLPAALIIFAMAAYSLVCWLKRFKPQNLQTKPQRDIYLAIVLFFTLTSNCAYSLVDGVIVMPISQVMMFTFIGLMIGYYNDGKLAEPATQNQGLVARVSNRYDGLKSDLRSNGLSRFKPVFAGIVLVALVWSTLPEILQSAAGSEKHFSMGYTSTGPRFWLEVK